MKNSNLVEYQKQVEEVVEETEPPSQQLNEKIQEPTIYDKPGFRKSGEKIGFSEHSQEFYSLHFPGSTPIDWSSWQWQIRNSIISTSQLNKLIRLTDEEVKPEGDKNDNLPLRITPYYASLLAGRMCSDAIRKTVVPTFYEMIASEGEASDPLSEGHDSPVPNIVHRYPDRVLFLVTGFCSTYCRYCTRSHMVAKDKCHIGIKAWAPAIEYIRNHPEVRDVLISGGDPLTMPDSHIEYLLSNLRQIPHVEIIRMGTKVPAVLPQRITRSLTNILKKYHPLFLSLHFTHSDELTPEVTEACACLADAGIPLGSQTVLLKGINDNVDSMKQLMQGLLKIRVRPYYIYQCDPILGSAHFRTPVEKGLEIIKGLRGHTTGYAVPHYVIDAPGGGGKIPLLPEYFIGREGNDVLIRNYEGKIFKYPDTVK
jgi:lysine 2,3-aminomutase